MHHDLKILPAYFEAVMCGDKRFEIRDNRDRGFQRGDTIRLREWRTDLQCYTGHCFRGRITYVTNYEQKDGFVVFGFVEAEGE